MIPFHIGDHRIVIGQLFGDALALRYFKIFFRQNIIDSQCWSNLIKCVANARTFLEKSILQVVATQIPVSIRTWCNVHISTIDDSVGTFIEFLSYHIYLGLVFNFGLLYFILCIPTFFVGYFINVFSLVILPAVSE